jgi:hypothetical protein
MPRCIGSTALLVGMSQVRSPVVSLGIFSVAFDHSWCPGSTQPLKMSTGILVGERRPVRLADNVPPSSADVMESGSLNLSEPSGPHRPVKMKHYFLNRLPTVMKPYFSNRLPRVMKHYFSNRLPRVIKHYFPNILPRVMKHFSNRLCRVMKHYFSNRLCRVMKHYFSNRLPRVMKHYFPNRLPRVDGRLGSRLWGYHPIAPRPLRYGPFVHRL